jgi:exopolyphosphatase / guanosine-5'-triphosphate,3'-diphosphate pyrophosphatase
MTSRRLAILDLGTNTFHLLIAEVAEESVMPIFKEKISVKIGEKGISFGLINKEAEERAIEAISHFCKVIEKYNIKEVFANATSAFRNAVNGVLLADKIRQITGIRINIISGAKEAELIYRGVRKAMDIGPEPALILDIGGGSNEFIICDQNQIYWKESFEIGIQRLFDIFHEKDPILKEDIIKLQLFLEVKLKPLIQAVNKFKPKVLIGASGAFDTLDEIYRQANSIQMNGETEFEMPIEKYRAIYSEIISKNKTERLQIPGMIEMRAEMIVVASCLINFVIRKCKIQRLRTSAFSLKEGILHSILEEVRSQTIDSKP